MRSHLLLPALFFSCLLPPLAAQEDDPTKDLFLIHCAACHGETGDGKGTTELERPARSFLDGGFSYGNTPEAVLRTLSFGIPGTPMPAFDVALTKDQREALAQYVISLGPPGTIVDPAQTELVVKEETLLARGLLPPIFLAADKQPRGLLIGLPSGTTFEYRTDDVRLLGVRSGRFVDRMDWTGRGGAALKPLGRVIELFGAGKPKTSWYLATIGKKLPPKELGASMRTSFTRGTSGGLGYELIDNGTSAGLVMETVSHVRTPVGSGWRRSFTVRSEIPDKVLRFDGLDMIPPEDLLGAFEGDLQKATDGHTDRLYGTQHWLVRKNPSGFQVTVIHSLDFPNQGGAVPGPKGDVGFWIYPSFENVTVNITRLTCLTWDDATRTAIAKELSK